MFHDNWIGQDNGGLAGCSPGEGQRFVIMTYCSRLKQTILNISTQLARVMLTMYLLKKKRSSYSVD